ncbi:NADPH oxidase 5-like [Physella acuta]|uniref:NADPH oxidase 5-like n=1 Tax=Physella acuta TaxID=109671 RepID=UPI0027DB3862|nr:NADPH oxidase 5-like [Physella acuta]
MPSRKKKTQISSLSFLTSSERVENLNVPYQPTPTLGLGDVIYENVTAEDEEMTQVGESLGGSVTSDPISSAIVRPSSAGRKPDTPSTLTVPAIGMYPALTETLALTTPESLPYSRPPRKQATKRSQRDGSSTPMELDLGLPPALPSRKRRESGVSLLLDPTETAVVYDTLPCLRSRDVSGTRSSSASSIDGSRSISSKTLRMKALLSPEEAWLSSVETRLAAKAGTTETLNLHQFTEALQIKESFFVERCFQLFDKDHDGEVNLQNLIKDLRALVLSSPTEKIRFLFNVYNIRGTGKICKTEVHQVLKAGVEESKLQLSEENILALTEALITAADKDKDGKISFDELTSLVQQHPHIANNLAISTLMSNTQAGIEYVFSDDNADETKKKERCCRHLTTTYIQNNFKKIFFLFFYLLINAGLGVCNAWRYWHKNTWLIVARIFGLCLDFNCTFIVVLMLRRLITYLRATPLVKVLPFDQHIMFHKICGYMITIQSVGHTVAHLGNAFLVAQDKHMSVLEVVFTTKADIGWIAGTAPLTGVALCLILVVMVVLSLPFIRRSGCFEVFYWSHKLYLAFWVLLIVHCADFWKWFVVPGFVFLLEAVSTISWIRTAYMGKTYIQSVCILPSEVTHLLISRPAGFTFKAGDYVFIKIPAISKHEWHPFTISSAPEQADSLGLHIRCAGYWTQSLHDYFVNYVCEDIENTGDNAVDTERKSNLIRRASSIAWQKQKPLKARLIDANIRRRVVTKCARVQCHLDGPYGTPSRHIYESEHAVLIGSGIGITPFASILQSIVSQFKASCVKCPKCTYTWCHKPPASVMNLKKVDFIWINRDQRHFEWFVSLLSRLEREQEIEGGLGHILDMHMYMTSAPPKTDMKGLILQMALDIVHEKEKTDLITGLQTRTQAGRPDFDLLFRKISKNAKGRVTVFFCGSPLLGKTLKQYSHKYGFVFRHEYF